MTEQPNDKNNRREEQPTMREDLLIGRNAVLELLRSEKPVESIFLQKEPTGTLLKIAAIARERGIVIKQVNSQKLDFMCAHAVHQGVVAQLAGHAYSELEDIIARAVDEPLFVVLCDGIEDPHNLGAIIRSAEAAGAHGLIIPKRRNVGLTHIVSKASAGAVSHLPVARVANLAATIDMLKKRGVWVYAADLKGKSWCETDFSGPVGLVIGSEGNGVSRLVSEKCDFSVSIPMRGKVSSLNASVATGIVLFEIARQRMGIKAV